MKDKVSQEKDIPEIIIQASIGKAILKCKNCSNNMTKYLPEKYRAFEDCMSNERYIDEKPVIHQDIMLKEVSCPICGCNLFEADIGVVIK